MNIKFRTGRHMPLIGFGTFQLKGKELIKAVLDLALAAGYRLIDTAYVYGNEKDIGLALKELLPKYNLKRENIFITSKLPPSHHGNRALEALYESLSDLDCSYIDLYLIHWPGQSHLSPSDVSNKCVRMQTWQQLMKAQEKGLVRDIGVSNYTLEHMIELIQDEYATMPCVNQVEWHPHYYDTDLKEYCQSRGILLQAYSSFGGSNNPNLLSDPDVLRVSQKLNKDPSQVLLCWAIQQDIPVIPKSKSKRHIESNFNITFRIPKPEMEILSNIRIRRKYAWDPSIVL